MTVPVFRDEQDSYVREEDGITVYSRVVACRDVIDIKPGQHVVFGGPSQHGKTTLAFDILQYTATPETPAYIAVSKPSDPVTLKRGTELHYRFVQDWPVPRTLGEIVGDKKPAGYVIWPQFGDMNTDMDRCAEITERLLMDRYAAGSNPKKNKGGFLVMDDTMVKAKLMGQDRAMVTILAMGGAMKLGLWAFVQKPTDSGRTATWSYEMADHLLLFKGGDKQMLRRYVEIIGEKGPIAQQVIPTLKEFQSLYVHRPTGNMCIVDAG